MIAFANVEYQKLEQTLNKIANDSDTPLSQAERSIDVILQSIDSLKVNINSRPFNNVGEEILFFKQIKPKFTAKLIYNVELLKIEGKRPIGSHKTQQRYIEKQLKKLETSSMTTLSFINTIGVVTPSLMRSILSETSSTFACIMTLMCLTMTQTFPLAMTLRLERSLPMNC